jgi:hypothetical protein
MPLTVKEFDPFGLSYKEIRLERQANKLLSKAHAGKDKESPAYSETSFYKRDLRNQTFLIPDAIDAAVVDVSLRDVAWSEIQRGAKKAGLSFRQKFILELRACEVGFEMIADQWNDRPAVVAGDEKPMCRQTCARDLQRAVESLNRIDCFALYTVLAEIFRCSVGRVRDILRQG